MSRRGSSPAPIPIHAQTSIWNGSHGPTPPVIRAEANSDVHPSTNPKPGPKTLPARMSRKKTSSIPAVPAPSPRRIALTADSTPRIARTRASIPPSLNSASTTTITSGSSARKMKGGSMRADSGTSSSSGQPSIINPAREARASTIAER